MNKLWRGISIFVLGGVLGTGLRRCRRIFHLPVCLPATGGLGAAFRHRAHQAGRVRHVHPCQPVRPRPLRQGSRQCLRAQRLSRIRFRGRPGTGVPRLSGSEGVDPLDLRRQRPDVRRSRRAARIQGQPALLDPGRRRSAELSERDHLVPAVRRSDLPSRPDHGCRGEVNAPAALESAELRLDPGRRAGVLSYRRFEPSSARLLERREQLLDRHPSTEIGIDEAGGHATVGADDEGRRNGQHPGLVALVVRQRTTERR